MMRIRRLPRGVPAIFLLSLAMSACTLGSEGGVPPSDCAAAPVVIQRSPQRGEELLLDGEIELVFDRSMDRDSVKEAFSLSPDVEGSFAWPDGQTLRFQPAASLARDAIYRVTLATGASDAEGTPLAEAYTFCFRTVGYLMVTQVIPAPDSERIEADSTITVMFNRPVVPLIAVSDPAYEALPEPVRFTPHIAGSGEWLNTSIYVFTPKEPLAGGTVYTACVAAGLTDTTGGLLAEDYLWSFSTQPPEVTWVSPDEDEKRVSVDTTIQVTFNMPIDPESAQARFTLRRASSLGGLWGHRVEGRVEVVESTLIFSPAERLDFDRRYVASIDAGVTGVGGGQGMRESYTWHFTTVPLPRILGTDPKDGERDAPSYTSFKIHFNTPINPDTVMSNIEIAPSPSSDQVHTYFRYWDNTFVINFGVQPSTEYTVKIGPDIADPYGNTTGQRMTVRFRTAPLPPAAWLHIPGRVGTYSAAEPARILVAYRNTKRLELTLYRLTIEDYFRFQDDWYDFKPPAAGRLRRWSVEVEGPLNELCYRPVELAEGGGTLAPGIYLLDLRADGVRFDRWGQRHVLTVSAINLTLKSDERRVLIWATDLETGAPVPELALSTYDGDGERYATATTDPEGLVSFPAPPSVGWYGTTVIGDAPFTIGSSYWNDGISVWEFGFDSESLRDLRAHIDTDRPIYRPGQTVYFRGIVRAEDDARYRLPRSDNVEVSIYDPAWEQVYDEVLLLDEFGVFTGELVLPEGAALGDYWIEAALEGVSFNASFRVAAYRPPEFEVAVTPDQDQIARGDANRATVEVRYFFGGAVAGVPVQWNILAEDYRFRPDRFGRYTFSDVDDPWICWDCWWWRPAKEHEVILSGSGTTNAEGRLVIDLPGDAVDTLPEGSYRLIVETTVYGNDGQVLSGRTSVVVHRGDFYIGLSPRRYVGRAGDEMSVDLVTVNWEGDRLSARPLEYTVYRREWINTYLEEETGGGHWEWESNDIEVASGTLATSDRAEEFLSFIPPEGGSYKVLVRGRDVRERVVQSSLFVWVSGREYVSWRRSNDDRITLIPDKGTYTPGETAEILIPSPFEGEQWALFTIERGTLLQHEVVLLTSNSTVYRLPITADHVPNIYVSIVIVQGRGAALHAAEGAPSGMPATTTYKVGYTSLAVEPVPQTVRIELSPSVEEALPGAQVTIDLRVTDAAFEPVVAALSLDLVDKAILTLKPRTPEAIVQAFYGRRGLGVNTSSGLAISINRLMAEQMNQTGALDEERFGLYTTTGAQPPLAAMAIEEKAGAARAPSGAVQQLPAGVKLREEFADTAYWNAKIVTGKDGTARVTVDLPDNLTTWVLRSVGVTQGTQVGEATGELLVTKPLLVRPVTPRFFVTDDQVQLAAIVNNNTETLRTVEVTLGCAGLILEDPAVQWIDVPADGEVKVTWWARVQDIPQVDLAISAVSGDLSDAARPRLTTGPNGTLLVYRYTAPEIVGTAGELTGEGSRTEVIALPPKYDHRRGDLSIRLDPSLAAGMREGLDYLEHFEYECTEQVVSRFLPNVLTYRALTELGLENAELEKKLPVLVREGLDKLTVRQNSDGGWGWWALDESSPYLTAYVVFALDKVREAGFDVESDMLEHGLDFLDRQLVRSFDLESYREANCQAWILYVMAEAGRTAQTSERTTDLFDARAKLSHYARAYFAMALSLINPDNHRIQTLLSDIQNAAILSATGAHWEEGDYDWWAMNTDTRSTAVILAALARLDPENALIPNVVRWLMIARRDGIWETTQETAWALIALTDWMVVTRELQGSYDYSVRLNNTLLASGDVTPDNVQESIKLSVDVADLLSGVGNRLTVARGPGDGRLYYTAHLKVYLPVEEIEPLNRGIIVQRQYVPADCPLDKTCEEIDSAAVGEAVQVRLTLIAPHDLYYVVLEDPIPAGTEAVDPTLATTSLLEQEPRLFRETDEDAWGWGLFYWWWWRWYSRSEMRDEKVVLFADYLSAGTYSYQYTIRATQPGNYHVLPTTAHEFYFPEVFGRADGRLFKVTEAE